MNIEIPNVDYELILATDEAASWQVSSIWVSEAINQPTRATIDAAIEAEYEADVDLDAVLGADLALAIYRGNHDPQHLFGLITRIDVLEFGAQMLNVRFHVGSAFELTRQSTDSRIWQNATVLGIVEEVLGAELRCYGRKYTVRGGTRGVTEREYCVQYRESTFDFVSRLLEEEGISYIFIHDPEQRTEVLTLLDANEQYAPIVSLAESDMLPLVANPSNFIEHESVQEFDRTLALTSTAATRCDFDWRQPESPHTAKIEGTDNKGRTRRVYSHTHRRFVGPDLEDRARDIQATAALAGSIYAGRSNATVLRAGARFKLVGHCNESLDLEYIVTSIRHSGSGTSSYANDFDCILASREIRPNQTVPRPRVHGPQTAIVTGDEDIHTDEHGRIQVQFVWEQSPSFAAGSSCWVRCAQAWAGAGWGAQFIPRVGMEVVVGFLEGNPDRPMVVGCVYDGSRTGPFVVPDSKTQSGWRTRSSPDSDGFNELRFEDAAGSEEIYVHAQRNLRAEIELDEERSIGGGRSTSIEGADDTLTISGGNSTRAVASGTDSVTAMTVIVTAQNSLKLVCGGSTIEMTPALVEIKGTKIKLN